MTSEVGETLEVVAREATLELTAPEGVVVESLSPFPTEIRGSRATIALGDLVADQRLQVVLRLNFPFGEIGRTTGMVLALADRDDVLARQGAKLG